MWLGPAVALAFAALALVLYAYRGVDGNPRTRLAMVCKVAGLVLLLLSLAEPMVQRVQAKPGANRVLLLVDDSRSMTSRDAAGRERAEIVRELLAIDTPWLTRLGQDFDLRRHAYDARLRSFESEAELAFDGRRSDLGQALSQLIARNRKRPVAAVVALTDGLATDGLEERVAEFGEHGVPIHLVLLKGAVGRDLSLGRIDVKQTSFEETPVRVGVDVHTRESRGDKLRVRLLDGEGAEIETHELRASDDVQHVRFDVPPAPPVNGAAAPGARFYRLEASFVDAALDEVTEANNTRWISIDRRPGEQRLLYVSGRPNWEFKFLRRALEEDPELSLVGLLRIARRQPRFAFREGQDRRNQLWSGFDNRDEEVGEQVDEPVLLRLGTRDADELRDGFPASAEELFAYDALILDDLEASFFTPDQMALIQQFVARRGGGLLMLGGEASFVKGGYRRTPLGDVLPVYLDTVARDGPLPSKAYELELSREGWLEPWIRLRSTEELEKERLAQMPGFAVLNRVGDVKPGAAVLLQARDPEGELHPAFVAQRYGRGRAAAMLIGDLWRWDLGRADARQSDLGTAWRQSLRWLVADVPRRVELDIVREEDHVRLSAVVRNAAFQRVHDARVVLTIEPPAGEAFPLPLRPSTSEPGRWEALYRPRTDGAYAVHVEALGPDGARIGTDDGGWAADFDEAEFRRLEPDRSSLRRLVEASGGSLLEADELEDFALNLALRDVPITETESDPLWHRWWFLASALLCFCAEWGLRRMQGMP